MTHQAQILCFTDVLCGHSYVARARFEQIAADFGDQVRLSFHFRSTYGDVQRRIAKSGGTHAQFNARSHEFARGFDHVSFHPELFLRNVPTSSMPAHLYLRAVKLLEEQGRLDADRAPWFERMLWQVQLAFFRDLQDISQRGVLDQIARDLGLPAAEIGRVIDDGRAYAELDHDAKLERLHGVQMSPALVLNDGRQVLNGNVGYRVIEANIRALLGTQPRSPSWL